MPIGTKPTDKTIWASSQVNVIEPTLTKKQSGFVVEKPAHQTVNWIWNNLTLWERYYEDFVDTLVDTGLEFDEVNNELKMAAGRIFIQNTDAGTNQALESVSRLRIGNTDGTANNFSDLSFLNQNDFIGAKFSARYKNHTNGETSASIWTTPASGALTESVTVSPTGNVGIGIATAGFISTEMLTVNGNIAFRLSAAGGGNQRIFNSGDNVSDSPDSLVIRGGDVTGSGNISGGNLTLRGGASNADGVGSTAAIEGGTSEGSGVAGNVLLRGGIASGAGANGFIIAESEKLSLRGGNPYLDITASVLGTDGSPSLYGIEFRGNAGALKGKIEGTEQSSSSFGGQLIFSTTIPGSQSTTEKVRIDEIGNSGFGTPNPSNVIHASASGNGVRIQAGSTVSHDAILVNNFAQSSTLFSVKGDGDVNIPTIGAATTGTNLIITGGGQVRPDSSSLRYKKEIVTMDMANSANIYNLRPVSYKFKDSGTEQIGLIAEEVATLLNELVFYKDFSAKQDGSDMKPESVNYDRVTLFVIEEMKKMKIKIDELETTIQELKNGN